MNLNRKKREKAEARDGGHTSSCLKLGGAGVTAASETDSNLYRWCNMRSSRRNRTETETRCFTSLQTKCISSGGTWNWTNPSLHLTPRRDFGRNPPVNNELEETGRKCCKSMANNGYATEYNMLFPLRTFKTICSFTSVQGQWHCLL